MVFVWGVCVLTFGIFLDVASLAFPFSVSPSLFDEKENPCWLVFAGGFFVGGWGGGCGGLNGG